MPVKEKLIPKALDQIRFRLYHRGFKTIHHPWGRVATLIVDGARVGVKYSKPSSSGIWAVNIHRHGKLDESDVDCYIFVLQNVPGNQSQPLHVVLRAPLGRLTYKFSYLSLMRSYRANIEDWGTLAEICKGRSKLANSR